jgi:hypothetical protein
LLLAGECLSDLCYVHGTRDGAGKCVCGPGFLGVECETTVAEYNAVCAQAMLAFKASGANGGAGWPAAVMRLHGWAAAAAVCGWYGVTCDATSGAVTELNLNSKSAVTGDVGHLAACTGLTTLILVDTGVSGEVAPLAALTGLTHLNLGDTGVSGNVAPLAACTGLTILSLYDTGVSGDVAPLAALTGLTILSLHDTGVSGSTAPILAATAMTTCIPSTMPAYCN